MSERYHYLVRRLHSFTGIFPVGLFLLFHMLINSSVFRGPEAYNETITILQKIPLLPYFEIFLIGVPIVFHGVYGLWITYVTKTALLRYPYFRNWAFYLQRVTAVITLAFVTWHVYVLRISRVFTGTEMSYEVVSSWLSEPAFFIAYVIGFLSAVFHFCNGLWSFLVSWGITIGPESQRFSAYVCTLIFIIFALAGITGLTAFRS